MTSGVRPLVLQWPNPHHPDSFIHSINSFTLDLPRPSTPRELQINLQLIRPVALRSIDVLSGVTDGECDS